jgi:hypothetical protein
MISHFDDHDRVEFVGGGPIDGCWFDVSVTFPARCHVPPELRIQVSEDVYVYYAEQTEALTQYIYMGTHEEGY